jgi:hypothetical protein
VKRIALVGIALVALVPVASATVGSEGVECAPIETTEECEGQVTLRRGDNAVFEAEGEFTKVVAWVRGGKSLFSYSGPDALEGQFEARGFRLGASEAGLTAEVTAKRRKHRDVRLYLVR